MNDPKRCVREGYDVASRAYRGDQIDELTQSRYARWISLLDSVLPMHGQVLDLGCGCGLPAARLLAEKYSVTGVDLSPVQIERARKLVPQAIFHCADFATFPLPADAYDAVVCLYAIIHIPLAEQPGVIRGIGNTIRRGGALLMIVGHSAWTGAEANWLGVAGATMCWSQESEETYRRWIVDVGLHIQHCEFVPEGRDGHALILAIKP